MSGVGALTALASLRALAQHSGQTYRVGAIFGGGAASMTQYRSALVDQLATHGFHEGRNLIIVARAGVEIYDTDRSNARELVAAKVDALFTCLTRVTQAVQAETQALPIVFTWVSDPLEAGLIKSYARPGGNATGVTNRFGELLIKRLELVRDLLPTAKRVAVVGVTPGRIYEARSLSEPSHRAAAQLGLELVMDLGNPGYWEGPLQAAVKSGIDAVVPFTSFAAAGELLTGERIVSYLNTHRIPAVFADSETVERGGLMSYGTNLIDDIKRGANLLARVLKGARPADLPVDQAARFELTVNMKTAKMLAIKIPQSILVRADRVIA